MFISEPEGLLTWDELSALITKSGYWEPLMKDFGETDVEPTNAREEAAYAVI